MDEHQVFLGLVIYLIRFGTSLPWKKNQIVWKVLETFYSMLEGGKFTWVVFTPPSRGSEKRPDVVHGMSDDIARLERGVT